MSPGDDGDGAGPKGEAGTVADIGGRGGQAASQHQQVGGDVVIFLVGLGWVVHVAHLCFVFFLLIFFVISPLLRTLYTYRIMDIIASIGECCDALYFIA